MRNTEKVSEKLYNLGKIVGLEANEIDQAKITLRSKIPIIALIFVFAFIGFFSARLETIGLWYIGASVKDFGLLNNFF